MPPASERITRRFAPQAMSSSARFVAAGAPMPKFPTTPTRRPATRGHVEVGLEAVDAARAVFPSEALHDTAVEAEHHALGRVLFAQAVRAAELDHLLGREERRQTVLLGIDRIAHGS